MKLPPVIKLNNECMVCYDCLVKWGRYEYTEGIAKFPLCKTCKEKREIGR